MQRGRIYTGPGWLKLKKVFVAVNRSSKETGQLGPLPNPNWFDDIQLESSEEQDGTFFRNDLHPTTDGYSWYRGWCFHFSAGDKLVVYTPWVWPQQSRDPLVEVIGDPDSAEIDRILDIIAKKCAEKLRFEPAKKTWRGIFATFLAKFKGL